MLNTWGPLCLTPDQDEERAQEAQVSGAGPQQRAPLLPHMAHGSVLVSVGLQVTAAASLLGPGIRRITVAVPIGRTPHDHTGSPKAFRQPHR